MISFRSDTIERWWAILEADGPFVAAITQNRRVKNDGAGWLKKMAYIAPNDFPYLSMAIGANWNLRPFPMTTFDQEPANFDTSQWLATGSADPEMRVVYRDEKQATDDYREEIEGKILAALMREGPTFGLDDVANWQVRAQHQPALVGGQVRPVTRLTIATQYEFDGATLIAPGS